MLTVTVNDHPLDVAAVVQNGRILVPMRATFGALGATVRFDPVSGVIVAHSPRHALRLSMGSQNAVVDTRSVHLDVAPRIIATRVYVPLRFVAQSMDAVVGYDARANIVTVASGNSPAAAGSAHGAKVLGVSPAPGSVASTAYPTISASLGTAAARTGEVTLTVDGTDVTSLASFDGSTITYMPRIGLTRGEHTVVFAGRTSTGETFSEPWSFDTSLEAPPDGQPLSTYAYHFYSSGPALYRAGDWMRFVLVAPPGGSAELQLCGLGYQYALWNGGSGTVYEADFPAPHGFWIPSCTVTATYTSWNGQQFFVPMPVVIGIYTGRNPLRATPSPKPRPIPSEPRRREPTPAPPPAATAHPVPAQTRIPAPAPTRAPIPARTAVPRAPVHPVPVHPVPVHPIPRRTP